MWVGDPFGVIADILALKDLLTGPADPDSGV